MKRTCMLTAMSLFLSTFASLALGQPAESVILEGTASEVGAKWGEVNKNSILKAYNAFIERSRGKEEQLRKFAKLSVDLSNQIDCSYWITELNAIADTVGIDRELYIAFTFGRYRDLALQYEGCTSIAVTPPATKDGQIIFHKTRETASDLQAGYIKRITDKTRSGKQPFKYFAEMGTADTGVSFFVNEKGLAGSADVPRQWQNNEQYVGPYKGDLPFVQPPKYDGFMNHYVPRYIAEHCSTVDEAGETLRAFAAKGYLASGKMGTNYLFADARGKVLQIADNCYEIIEENKDPILLKDGKKYEGIAFTVLRRNDYGAPEDALIANYTKIPVELVNSPKVSKHSAIWNFARAQSSSTFLIDPKHPDKLTTVFVTLPAYGYSIPFLMGASATPRALMDGTVYQTQKEAFRYSAFHEEGVNDAWRRFIHEVRPKVEKGEDVTKALNDNFLQMVNLVLSMNK